MDFTKTSHATVANEHVHKGEVNDVQHVIQILQYRPNNDFRGKRSLDRCGIGNFVKFPLSFLLVGGLGPTLCGEWHYPDIDYRNEKFTPSENPV
ncbi:hypothetical protein PHLCEN_2v3452 [Hermanssonia centrifuga]|uniref:Uncharacterized protein n=1 Tax=Hermanssonia centrifuga TaxID=98765 RepID=A0A2R6QIL9_9APHY|nr:hypothetical protein PHLCEN_2v3452 [Hermanssonia centrifuga]